MTKEEVLPSDIVSGEAVIEDDQYIEFYDNIPNMIHFDPPLTINEFKTLLDESLQQDGQATKMSGSAQK